LGRRKRKIKGPSHHKAGKVLRGRERKDESLSIARARPWGKVWGGKYIRKVNKKSRRIGATQDRVEREKGDEREERGRRAR